MVLNLNETTIPKKIYLQRLQKVKSKIKVCFTESQEAVTFHKIFILLIW